MEKNELRNWLSLTGAAMSKHKSMLAQKVKVEFTGKELLIIELCLEKLEMDVAKKWKNDPEIRLALRSVKRMRDKIVVYLSELEENAAKK